MEKGTVLARSLATHSALRQGSQPITSLPSPRVFLSLPIHLHTLFAKLVTHCSVFMMK